MTPRIVNGNTHARAAGVVHLFCRGGTGGGVRGAGTGGGDMGSEMYVGGFVGTGGTLPAQRNPVYSKPKSSTGFGLCTTSIEAERSTMSDAAAAGAFVGAADIANANAPATWGHAIDVPESVFNATDVL